MKQYIHKKKRVFVHAYLARNLGDDLFIYILCKRYPSVRFSVLADRSYQDMSREMPNLRVYCNDDRLVKRWDYFLKQVKHVDYGFWKMQIKFSDAVIHIGGSSFVQHSDDYHSFLECDRTLRRLSKRMYLIGSNFGPYTDDNYYHQYYQLFREYDGICFRDCSSYKMFEKLNNVRMAPDVVFQLRKGLDKGRESEKRVLISVIDLEWRGGKYSIREYMEPYEKLIQKAAEFYLEKGYIVDFVSFCEGQGDGRAIDRITGRMEKSDRIRKHCYHNNLKEILVLFSSTQIVIGTRFHSIILGWVYGKKVLPIVYDKKTQNVLDDLGYCNYLKLEELSSCNLADKLEKIHGLEDKMVNQLAGESEEQFWAVDDWLKG